MKRFLTTLVAVVLLAGFANAEPPAPPRSAPPIPCQPYAEMSAVLKDKFNETVIGMGLAPGKNGEETVVELYRSPTDTWTIVSTDHTGKSCMVGAGKNWDMIGHLLMPERGV